MNCIKLLNELMMKFRRSVNLNKKYLFAAIVMFCVQAILGTNLASAQPCEAEIKRYCSLTNSSNANWCYSAERTHIEMNAFINSTLRGIEREGEGSTISLNERLKSGDKLDNLFVCFNNAAMCMYKNGGRSQDSNTFTDYKGCDGGSQSSSSGSSSQSNKKTNRQANASQTSSSDDERVKKLNEAIDQSNNAHENKDYAKSIAAIKYILANSSNITLKAAAANRLGEYYMKGKGIQKDEVKAQALFEQASIGGDADADAHIGENYEEGTGGVIKNHQTAIKYYTAAAAKGQVDAMSKLGYLYHAGEGVKNPQLGNEWICKAAKQGESTAIRNAEKLKLSCN